MREDAAALREALPAYEVLGVLGRGAFAVVYAARHVGLAREVAIKRLSPELVGDRDARERFAAEARVLAQLDHPHVVRVHDYVESEAVCALVMEHMHGGTLADRARIARPGHARACAIAVGALHGLEHAHRHGVLHRDIKPENLLFGPGELVKVADFGIAKVVGARGARLTATAGALGTPAYMAPEQVRRAVGPLSPATDVWATGAVLYELLAGEPPFPRDEESDIAEVLLARVDAGARPLRAVAADVAPELEAVVMQALESDPQARFQTAAGFASSLEEATERGLGRGSIAATGVPIHRTEPAPAARTTLVEPAEADVVPPPRRRPSRRLAVALAACAIAVAGAVALVLALSSGGGSNPLAGLPSPPPGWPTKLAVGYWDFVSGPAGVARHMGPGSLAYENYGVGDAAAKKDWSHDRALPPPQAFAADAQRRGLMPYVTYYELRSMGRDGKDDANTPQIRKILVDHRLMRTYWANVRAFLTRLGTTRKPVAVSVEPSIWALLEQALGFTGSQPSDVPAVVASSGAPELKGLSDNLPGFSDAWRRLRDRYAPKVLLGATLDFYGTNIDVARELPSAATVKSAAAGQGRFFLSLSSTAIDFDFASWELAFGEAGSIPGGKGYTDAQKADVVAWLRSFQDVTKVPLVVESVPEGNTVMKTIDDKPFHYRDTWVQWLLGDARFTHLRELRDAGVVGVEFGDTSGSGETCACDSAHDGVTNGGAHGLVSRSPDDDGGYLAARVAALRRAGGLALAPPPPAH
jgi:tRNA A-37 threonylcarbamoyl transferase component Bud32